MQTVINALLQNNAELAMQNWQSELVENANTASFNADHVGDAVLDAIAINSQNCHTYRAGFGYLLPLAGAAMLCILQGQGGAATMLANNIYNELQQQAPEWENC